MAGPEVWRQLQEGGGAYNVLPLPPIIFVKSKTGVQAVLQAPVPQPGGGGGGGGTGTELSLKLCVEGHRC